MRAFDPSSISKIHIELSSYCNASCPMCPRFYKNSTLVRPDLNLSQITLEQFKKFFPKDYLFIIEEFLICGTHGDPGMAKDLYEICEYIATGDSKILLHTNGGMRNEEFWSKMGVLFGKHSNWDLVFSIDGLEDTNHIYRRGVEWDKLMKNCQAFIAGGGNAVWEYLVFRHNEHQVEEAREFAKKMGFIEFKVKKALGVSSGDYLEEMPVVNSEGLLDYTIQAPLDSKYRNLENPKGEKPIDKGRYEFPISFYKHLKKSQDLIKIGVQNSTKYVYEVMADENYSIQNNASVKCKSVTRGELFVTSSGYLLPCCYVGTYFTSGYSRSEDLQIKHEMEKWGLETFNLNTHSILDVLETRAFDRIFADSWTKPTCQSGKMIVCANTCGEHSSVDRIHGK